MTDAVSWETVENAIHEWVVAGSGLLDKSVIWDHEGGKRPAVPYIELSIDEIGGVGHDWRKYEAASSPTPGAELKVRVMGHRIATLTIDCFGIPSRGSIPLRILSNVVSALALSEYDLDISQVGIGVVGPVQKVPGQRGGILEPRAQVEIHLHLASNFEGRASYIQRIQTTITAKNPVGTTLSVQTFWTPDAPGREFSASFSSEFA